MAPKAATLKKSIPEGPYALGPQLAPPHQNRDGLLGPDSIMLVHMDPLGVPVSPKPYTIRLMDKILHDLKDPKLWELWYIPYYG